MEKQRYSVCVGWKERKILGGEMRLFDKKM